MSLYNSLFGMNPFCDLLLAMLNLTREDTGRFRDCYLSSDESDKTLKIVIYTRNGGGNRDDYEEETTALQALPTYITDYDNDYDCTYASYEFRVPEAFKVIAEELVLLGAKMKESPMERFKALIEKLETGDKSDPAVARAMEIGKGIFQKIEQQRRARPLP